MKKISLLSFFLLLFSGLGHAGYVQVCPAPGCDPSEMVWLEINPFGATVNSEVVALVVGGGLLLWSVGIGVGLCIQSIRKLR